MRREEHQQAPGPVRRLRAVRVGRWFGATVLILNRGRLMGNRAKGEITRDELVLKMSGGAALEALAHELQWPAAA